MPGSPLLRLVLAITAASLAASGQAGPGKHWYKGNLHTHTLNSDGDSTPDEVVTWYREQRYNFLVLSDHNYVTEIAGLNAVHGAKEKFLLIPGEEVSDRFQSKPVHLNAYNPSRLVEPQHGDSIGATIQNNVDEIRRAGGVPALNHPNFGWAIADEDMRNLKGLALFEVFNGHPMVNNEGGGGSPSLDEIWDALLTAGQRLYGVAVDDAHVFKRFGKGLANPGQGWVVVRAEALSADAILAALASGDFYASTGVRIRDIQAGAEEYRIDIETAEWEKVTTYFIGAGGKVLAKVYGTAPAYRYAGGEQYVRARVESSSGAKAWTQPVFRALP